MNRLIPYKPSRAHPDPDLAEFTYGNVKGYARKLMSNWRKGDYFFFHIGRNSKKYITAYYVVDRVRGTAQACRDGAIRAKYKNPHIIECIAGKRAQNGEEDAIVFGDPITSRVFQRPLLFDRKLAEKLSLKIKFPTNRTETQAIGSATRNWRDLTNADVKVLLKQGAANEKRVRRNNLRSTDEVGETLERDIENYIARNPSLLGKGLKLVRNQQRLGDGRLDLLFENKRGNWVIVELKLNRIGRDAVKQIKAYIECLRKENDKKVSGVIICSGVMPIFGDELRKEKDIQIFIHGWDLRVVPWSTENTSLDTQ